MGREIRRVPANWNHPKLDNGDFRSMYNCNFDVAFAKWLADFDRVRAGGMSEIERECYPNGLADWLQDDGQPPNPAYYHRWHEEDRTWFQMFETVSEGTPVTPPFATKEELINYLVEFGDFWRQSRLERGVINGKQGYSREAAEKFVMGDGYAPSFIIIQDENGTRTVEGIEASYELSKANSAEGTGDK